MQYTIGSSKFYGTLHTTSSSAQPAGRVRSKGDGLRDVCTVRIKLLCCRRRIAVFAVPGGTSSSPGAKGESDCKPPYDMIGIGLGIMVVGLAVGFYVFRRSARTKIASVEQQIFAGKAKLKSAEKLISVERFKVKRMRQQLQDARELVENCMASDSAILGRYEIPYSDLVMHDSIGEGSFGTV